MFKKKSTFGQSYQPIRVPPLTFSLKFDKQKQQIMNTIIINEKPECAGNRIEEHSDLPCQTENIVLPSNKEDHIADETYLNVNNCSVLLRVTCLNLGKK